MKLPQDKSSRQTYQQNDQQTVRLSRHDIEQIRRAAVRIFGSSVQVFLFGSRTDATARGGDIDLLIDTPRPELMTYEKRIDFIVEVKKAIGERKLDVLYNKPGRRDEPIIAHARNTGVPLQ